MSHLPPKLVVFDAVMAREAALASKAFDPFDFDPTCKRDVSIAFTKGRFGNTILQWRGVDAFEREAPDEGLYAARSYTPHSPLMRYGLTKAECAERLREIDAVEGKGAAYANTYLDAPYKFNAEIVRVPNGYLSVKYSLEDMPQRKAFATSCREVSGLTALMLLRTYVSEDALDAIYEATTRFPCAVVELTVFHESVGLYDVPYVIWEVREY